MDDIGGFRPSVDEPKRWRHCWSPPAIAKDQEEEEKPHRCANHRIQATRIFSGRYGAQTLSGTVHFVLCIKIGAKFFIKKTLNFIRLLLSGLARVSVNPWHYKVLHKFSSGSITETKKFCTSRSHFLCGPIKFLKDFHK
jgi:hypothetical protein